MALLTGFSSFQDSIYLRTRRTEFYSFRIEGGDIMSVRKLFIIIFITTMFAGHNAWADFDSGCIAVLVDDGDQIIDSADNRISLTTAAQRFYETHGDDYDFIMFFPQFNHPNGSFHRPIANNIEGIGRGIFNNRTTYGVPGSGRLQSLTNYVNFKTFPVNPEARLGTNNDSTLSLLAQEVGHRWAAFATHASGDNSLLGRQGAHWSYYFHAPSTGPVRNGASSLEGNVWTDNGDGTFTTGAQTDGFSELDQYLMGVRAASAVTSPMFFIQNPSGGFGKTKNGTPFRAIEGSDTVSGTRVDVSIADIIATIGVRNPSAAEAPKNFKQVFILLAPSGTSETDPTLLANITTLDGIRVAWEDYFIEETDTLGSVDACVRNRPLDIVFIVDISGSFSDDLPVLQANVLGLAQTIIDAAPSSRFALATFSDFPFDPFGSAAAGDFAYRLDLPLTEGTAGRDALDAAVQNLTILNALDGPQSQYEAIFQVLTGAGRDLNSDGDFTDLGEIQPSDIGASPTNPMFIFLFTDATFHNSDVEPAYPGAGRTEVLALLQSTPFIFGLTSGAGNSPSLQEIVVLTGGDIFDLGSDSEGFEIAVLEAIETTEPPPNPTVSMLAELTIDSAHINWVLDDLETQGLAAIDLRGVVKLPSDKEFLSLNPTGVVNVHIGERQVLNADLNFSPRSRRLNRWVANEVGGRGFEMKINWVSPITGNYIYRGVFDPAEFALSGAEELAKLDFVLSLGDEMMSKDTSVFPNDWNKISIEHWKKMR